MTMPALPQDWEATRESLQRYAQAITAHARAGAEPDPRWRHVSLDPVVGVDGLTFVSAPVPVGPDTKLIATLDPIGHLATVTAGDDVEEFDLTRGPSPRSIGEAMIKLAATHGSTTEVDRERFADDDTQTYQPEHAAMWAANAAWVVLTLGEFAASVDGETAGPHLWPHGFDIATEWFSSNVVDENGSNAQIAAGFYPAGDAYFYVNPWPFTDAWADVELPGAATWNTDGWDGAKLEASSLGKPDDVATVVDLVQFVHSLTRPELEYSPERGSTR